VGVDENEPEVLFDGLHHAREHMAVEMTLAIMHWLVDGYGTDPTITSLVNGREIWIVFNVNPDGGEYDISGGRYHFWRKNRQPTRSPSPWRRRWPPRTATSRSRRAISTSTPAPSATGSTGGTGSSPTPSS